MSYPDWFNEILRCPESGGKLKLENNVYYGSEGAAYKIDNEILSIVFPKETSGEDARMNKFYNLLAPFYDFNERFWGKLIAGVDMVKGRENIVSLLGLRPGMRVLEVSPGPGVFHKLLHQSVGENGEIVSLDLSMSMLRQCQIRDKGLNIYLVQGNAQYLPFADDSFDALFHFGGLNLFNDPQKAIDEFIRVVKGNGIVSWGDEGFSKDYPHNFRRKLLTRINPGYLKERPIVPLFNSAASERNIPF